MTSSILIAEQEPETRVFLKTLLERAGYVVFLSINADHAIEQASVCKPALIIIDALLPDDGAARLIQECQSLPVIVTSAIPMKSLLFRHKVFEVLYHPTVPAKPVPFLEKPLQEDELFALIHSLIQPGISEQPLQRG